MSTKKAKPAEKEGRPSATSRSVCVCLLLSAYCVAEMPCAWPRLIAVDMPFMMKFPLTGIDVALAPFATLVASINQRAGHTPVDPGLQLAAELLVTKT